MQEQVRLRLRQRLPMRLWLWLRLKLWLLRLGLRPPVSQLHPLLRLELRLWLQQWLPERLWLRQWLPERLWLWLRQQLWLLRLRLLRLPCQLCPLLRLRMLCGCCAST